MFLSITTAICAYKENDAIIIIGALSVVEIIFEVLLIAMLTGS